ncbi:unnamed protein product [Cuscuta epithymum]|uniref:Uncharacterized protein n=1 Tax=Cuscuta epithymum TaxID=186058 RepID=A0AAV0CQK3_9ASTE|nr:unnamed protein product [Cuscuta epithymum]
MIITIFLYHDRPLSAIVSRLTVRLAHCLPGWRRTSYAVRSAPQRHRTWLHGSARPFPPGWRRPSYAARSASQRHRVSFTFGSPHSLPGWRRTSYAVRSAPQRHRTWLRGSARPFPSRMETTVLCSTIGFSVPSCLVHVRIAPFPSRMATNVLCSAIGPSAPSYLASRFGSPIPSRMATTVLCSTIGFSAPSCLFHVRIAHLFQDGDERLMRYDRPLSAIVPRFTVRLAHSLQDGDDRLMQHDRLLSAIVSLSRSDRPIPSRMATNVLCSAIGPSAPSYLASRFGSPISLQDGDDRLMQHDQRPSAIVPGSR